MTEHGISDEEYIRTQTKVALISGILQDSFERGELEAFLDRSEREQSLIPIVQAIESDGSSERLALLEADARVLLTARTAIVGEELTIQQRVDALPEDRFPRPKESQ